MSLNPANPEPVADLVAELQCAALPLPTFLRHLALELRVSGWRAGFERLATLVEKGMNFATAVDDAEVKRQLPVALRDLLRTGHEEGMVSRALELVEIQRQGQAERAALLRSLAYPALITLVALFVCCILASIIVNFIEPFTQDSEFPTAMARTPIYRASHVGLMVAKIGLPGCLILLLVTWALGGLRFFYSLLAEVPLLGAALRWSSIAQWLRVTAIAVEQQQNLATAIRHGGAAQDDLFLQSASESLASDLERGMPLSVAWRAIPILPASLVPLWKFAEERNATPLMLQAGADLLAERSRNRSELITKILPPLMLIVVGTIVFALLWGIIAPLQATIQNLSSWSMSGASRRSPPFSLGMFKLGFLCIPAITMLVSLRIMYGPRQTQDRFRSGFALTAYWLLGIAALGLMLGLLEFASFWMIPITVVVLFAAWTSFRRSEDRSLMQAVLLGLERQIPVLQMVRSFALERGGRGRPTIVANALEQGMPLSQALRKGGIALPSGTRAAITLVEHGTPASPLLHSLLQPNRRTIDETIDRLVRKVLMWLSFIPTGGFVFTFLMIYIAPVQIKMFEEFGVKLGEPFVVTANLNYYLARTPLVVIFPLFVVALAFVLVIQQLGFRFYPYFSWVRRRYDSAMVLHLLAAGMHANLPLTTIMHLLEVAYDYRPVQRRLQRANMQTVQGLSIWQCLSKVSLLRPTEVPVLEAAQRVGNLPQALENLSDTILRRLEFRLHVWTQVINTIGLLVASMAVMMAVAIVILPLANLILGLSGYRAE